MTFLRARPLLLSLPLLLFCLAALCGCNDEVTDTEARTFRIQCENENCVLIPGEKTEGVADADGRNATAATDSSSNRDSAADGPANDQQANADDGPETSSFVVQKDTRVLRVCPTSDEHARACRALTCDSAAVCSRLGGPEFSCVSQLCQATARSIESADRVALCLAGTGPWTRSRSQLERFTLARGCRPPCDVPADCRQP